MRWPPKKVIMAIVIIAIILLIWSGRSMRAASTEHLLDRVWIDRVTEEPRELVELLYFMEGHDVGLSGKRSHYRFSLDFVRWTLEEDRLSLHLLQEDRRVSYRARTWKCAPGEAPNEDFEYCMTLTGPDGTRKYFAADQEDAKLRALLQ
jgi:hypothetical protein